MSEQQTPVLEPAHVSSAMTLRRPSPAMFSISGGIKSDRSPVSFWTAMGAHAVVIALIAWILVHQVRVTPPVEPAKQVTILTAPPPPPPPLPPPVLPKAQQMGGGGGQHDLAPVPKGHLPKFAEQQIVPPKAPPTVQPKLAVEPTVVVQKDLKLADNTMPNLGMPTSTVKGPFSGGMGSGTGLGNGNGNGLGNGSGGNTGGGVFKIGGGVKAPVLVHQVDAEFSEEARKAKFSGNVEVYLQVTAAGLPDHIRVVRGVGMGLDEKAMEAVRQYRFRPGTKDGKPVATELYVDVNFQIF